MNRRIFIMRHANPLNPTGVLYGNMSGFPLSPLGQGQAAEAGKVLSGIPLDHIISSPLERAYETAQIVASTHPSTPAITTDKELRDVEFGQLEGSITIDELNSKRSEYWQGQQSGQYGGEYPLDTQARIRAAFDKHLAQLPAANLLFVFHAGPIAYLMQSLLGEEIQPSRLYSKRVTHASVWEVILEPSISIVPIFKP